MQAWHRSRLLAKPDQGRSWHLTSTCVASNHMLHAGKFTRFCDWQFMHRARLGVLPLYACRRWDANRDRRCRRCGEYDETTAHVLCHCHIHLATVTRQHNTILDRLVDKLQPQRRAVNVRVNQTVPFSDILPNVAAIPVEIQRQRPDLLIYNSADRSVVMVDVTTPFESGPDAFLSARLNKRNHYGDLINLVEAHGIKVTFEAFVVGALGGWDYQNFRALKALQVKKRCSSLLARFCCSDAIRWSRDIYIEHVTGHRQYPP